VIRELVIEGGTIFVGALGMGRTVPLPRIEMANIGEDGTKANIAEVLDMVLAQVLTSIGPAIANAGELTKGAVDALKTQGLERVGQASGKAEEAANEATKAVSEGLQNLLGN